MRKEVVATFIFYHGDGSGISCSRFRLYGSGETGRNKAEKARKENNSILAEKYEKEAKKWSESGTNRIAMHGIMGALVSKEAGAGMTKGLTGAGLNALLQKELGKIKDKEVHKIASAAIGYLAGGKTGADIAHQATTFNYLTHEQYEQYLDDMKKAKTEEDKARMKDRWLQIDAEQNEEWLRKQGTGTYIDLSTIKKGDMPGQVILEKRNGYKEALKKGSIGDGNGHSSEMIPLALRSAAMAVITNEVGRPWKELEKTGVRGSLRIIGKYNAIGMAIDGAIDLTSDFNTYSGSNLKWALTIDGGKTLIGLGMSVTPISGVISGPILDGGAYKLKEALLSRDMTKEKTNQEVERYAK